MADDTTRKPGPGQSQGHEGGGERGPGGGGSRMPGRNPEDEQAAADMGKSVGAGAQGDAADRAEVDRPDLNNRLNNQDVE
jgi:hypothetical protein